MTIQNSPFTLDDVHKYHDYEVLKADKLSLEDLSLCIDVLKTAAYQAGLASFEMRIMENLIFAMNSIHNERGR